MRGQGLGVIVIFAGAALPPAAFISRGPKSVEAALSETPAALSPAIPPPISQQEFFQRAFAEGNARGRARDGHLEESLRTNLRFLFTFEEWPKRRRAASRELAAFQLQ